jgi:hypothetical protein
MVRTAFALASIALLQAPFAFGQTCQQLLDSQFSGSTIALGGEPLPNIQKGGETLNVIDAMKRVQGMVYLETVPGTTNRLTDVQPDGNTGTSQWFPFCSSQTMGPNQYEVLYKPQGWKCASNDPGDDISPCEGQCGSGDTKYNPFDSYKQCCDKPMQAGPCSFKDGIPALNSISGKSGSMCKKRWEWSSVEIFAEACRASYQSGEMYGIPYFMSGFTHDKQGPTQTDYYYKFEDANFICMPGSCTASEIRAHLQDRADACTDSFQTGCMYWLREIQQSCVDFTSRDQHSTTDLASKAWAQGEFGYQLEDTCTNVNAGEAAGAGSLAPPDGKFTINAFLNDFMGIPVFDCKDSKSGDCT